MENTEENASDQSEPNSKNSSKHPSANPNVDEEEYSEGKIVFIRKIVFFSIIILSLYSVYYVFTPSAKKTLQDPLNTLSYEAIAMEEDKTGERISLPSNSASDIQQYYDSSLGLDFSPRFLNPIPKNWKIEGASIIDYEIAKIAVTQFENINDAQNLFHFTFQGQIDTLPESEQGNKDGLIYQAYASDQINVIAWQDSPRTISLLVGHISVLELADIAKFGTPN